MASAAAAKKCPLLSQFLLSAPIKPKPCLVHKRGRLQSLAGCLRGHLVRSQFPEFLVDQGQQLLRRLFIALLDLLENMCELTHCLCHNPCFKMTEVPNLDGSRISSKWRLCRSRQSAELEAHPFFKA